MRLDVNPTVKVDTDALNDMLRKYKGILYFPKGSLNEEENKLYKVQEVLNKRKAINSLVSYGKMYNSFTDLKHKLSLSNKRTIDLEYRFSDEKRTFLSNPAVLEKASLGLSVVKCQELASDKKALVVIDLLDALRVIAFEITRGDAFLEESECFKLANKLTDELGLSGYVYSDKFFEMVGLEPDEDLFNLKNLRFENSSYTRYKDPILMDKKISCNYFGKDALVQDGTFFSALEESNYYLTAIYLKWFLDKIKRWRVAFSINGIGEGYFILSMKKEAVNRVREFIGNNELTVESLGKKITTSVKIHSISKESVKDSTFTGGEKQ